MFSKKTTKIGKIFTVDLTVTTYIVKVLVKIFVNFFGLLKNVNFSILCLVQNLMNKTL